MIVSHVSGFVIRGARGAEYIGIFGTKAGCSGGLDKAVFVVV
jgi:hypothetical protein